MRTAMKNLIAKAPINDEDRQCGNQTLAIALLGRAKPQLIALAVQKAPHVEFVEKTHGIRNRDTALTQFAFSLQRIIRANCNTRIGILGRRSVPV